MGNLLQLGAVAAVLAALWITVHWLRRRQQGTAASRLSIQQRLAVTNQLQLLVVRWDDNELLLSASGQGCQVLASAAANEDLSELLASLPTTSPHLPNGPGGSPFLVSVRSPQ